MYKVGLFVKVSYGYYRIAGRASVRVNVCMLHIHSLVECRASTQSLCFYCYCSQIILARKIQDEYEDPWRWDSRYEIFQLVVNNFESVILSFSSTTWITYALDTSHKYIDLLWSYALCLNYFLFLKLHMTQVTKPDIDIIFKYQTSISKWSRVFQTGYWQFGANIKFHCFLRQVHFNHC